MKLIYIIIFAFSLNFAAAQDFWEEIDLPSNRPVGDIYKDEQGNFYTSGVGVFSSTDLENWNDINDFIFELDSFNFTGKISAMPVSSNQVMKFQDTVLIVLNNDGASFMSRNNGQLWEAIELVSPEYMTKYNDNPYIAASDGIFTFNYGEYSFENLTKQLIGYDLFRSGSYGDILYMTMYADSKEKIFIFDIPSETITDSVNKSDLGLAGEYRETADYSYLLRSDTLFVNDEPIRNAEDINFTENDLNTYNNGQFRKYLFNVLEDGKIFISNYYGGFIIAEPGFENPKYYQSPNVFYNRVLNLKIIDDEYYLGTVLGLYRSKNKDLTDTEFLSENMGSGIYQYINEENNEFQLISSGIISTYDGAEHIIKSENPYFISQWKESIWYQPNDTMYVSRDFSDSWERAFINESQTNEKFILSNGDMVMRSSNLMAYVDYETLEVTYKPQPNYGPGYTFEFHLLENGNDLYIFANDGLYNSDDYGDSWSRIRKFDFDEEIPYYQAEITNIGDVFIVVSRDGIFYSNDLGETWVDMGFGESFEEISYIKWGDAVYVGAGYIDSDLGNTIKLTVNNNEEVVIEDLTEGIDNLYRGQFTKGTDGKLYVSYLHGNFRSAEKVVTSVEELPELPGQEDQISIYPNVSSDFITVNLNASSSKPIVYHITGKAIDCPLEKLSNNSFKVDIRNLDKGMYVIVDGNSENPEGSFFFRE